MRLCLFADPAGIHNQRTVRALERRGVQCHVVYRGEGKIEGATYEPFAVPPAAVTNPRRFHARRERYLRQFLENYDAVGIIFLQDWCFTPELLATGRAAIWLMGSDIDPPPHGPQLSPQSWEHRKMMLRHAHAVAALSKAHARIAHACSGRPLEDIQIVPLGVDLDFFQPAGPLTAAPVVGYLKGFGHAYGAPTLMEAIPIIREAVPDVRFDLVGKGPERDACRDAVAALGVQEAVRWLESVPHAQVPALMTGWRVSVMPSRRESLGVAAMESSAMGLPVVASAVGGLPEVVRDGVTGTLIPPDDPAALAKAVIALLRDQERCVTMGRAGRRHIRDHFAAPAWEDAVEQFFRAAAGVAPATV